MIPQYIVLFLMVLGLGAHIAKHGEPRNENYNAATQFLSALIVIGLLWWGGFFEGMF